MKKFYFLLLALGLFTGVNAQIINFPDANFKKILLLSNTTNNIARDSNDANIKIDINNDGQIQVNEALMVYKLNINDANISDLNGIDFFSNLTVLVCFNNMLTSLNVNNLIHLTELDCNRNSLTSLNVSSCINLKKLICQFNNLVILDVSGLNTLEYLFCRFNYLTSINLGGNSNLRQFDCERNQLTNLDLNGLNSLQEFNCGLNLFQLIDISNLQSLDYFDCTYNDLLTAILMKNNGLTVYDMYNNCYVNMNPNLKYICVEEARQSQVISGLLANRGITGVEVNSYCSFVPSNPFYIIQGNNRFDSNNNGCDALDLTFSNFQLKITNNSISRNYFSGYSGNYYIPVATGTNTIVPVFENPTYFNISPSSTTVAFPTQASPFIQDFCVTPNGVHSDVEVLIQPMGRARPGFDAYYKIVYKNKGNQVENGAVNLAFDDAKIDYVSSSSVFSSQAMNQLTWNYTNLKPFETRSIDVVLNFNSPMETPAVNDGDVVTYTVTINSLNTDEKPNDNSFTLNQTVVNSFDPNDIKCLEGATVSTAKIGDYVHYMIRFENTGSANATNIVVKDVVDSAKFDLNSIVPINGSHDYYTRINGNNVEFIFENINLPFNDASNDGYLVFKIKIKSTLVAGDTFSKNANIYFDYNFPIVTNTANTVIAALSTQDFEFKNYFRLYPNPVSNILTIETKNTIQISSINIYNTLGQLVLVIPNAKETKAVDVSSLSAGNYFIKINSDKGTSNTKFIKQ